MKVCKDFTDTLRENLLNFKGEYDSYIDYAPDLFQLLTNLLEDKSISPKQKALINAALAYFVAPRDIIPEEIYGPFGYADDIYMCVYVIKKLEKDLGYATLARYWHGDGYLKEVVDECYEKSGEVVGDKADDILEYIGLK